MVTPAHATVTPVSHGTCRRPRTAGWTAAWYTGISSPASATLSLIAPSVTMPAAPRTWARSPRMSPMVPAVGSPRASMTSTSPGRISSIARFCAFIPAP